VTTSNYKTAIMSRNLIATLMVFFILICSFLFLIRVVSNELLVIIFSLIILVLCLMFMRIKVFVLENSGEVIVIKYYHFLENKTQISAIEFPASQLTNHVIRKTFLGYKITLTITDSKQRKVKRVYSILDFNRNNIVFLEKSLHYSCITEV